MESSFIYLNYYKIQFSSFKIILKFSSEKTYSRIVLVGCSGQSTEYPICYGTIASWSCLRIFIFHLFMIFFSYLSTIYISVYNHL